jgi:phage pi2 protein 07
MIRDNIIPDQKLAVGKPEYKEIIEDKLVSVNPLVLLF